jgi:hypothetical protein
MLQRIRTKYREELRVLDLGPCWVWTASRDGKGYGQISVDRRPRRAHRVIYELLVGPPPRGTELDHLCRVKLCVNPKHLQPVTHRTNVLRGKAPTAINAVKTHCPQGHEYTPENTYHYPKTGWRHCRVCLRANASRQQRARRARAKAMRAAAF